MKEGELLMKNDSVCGVEKKDVLNFFLKVTFRNQWVKISDAKDAKGVAIACLRLGFADAFGRTTKNRTEPETTLDKLAEDKEVLNTFREYVKANDTQKRVEVIQQHKNKLNEIFGKVKDNEEKPLCFGHYQKLFNMAVKLYLCIYIYCDEFDNDWLNVSKEKLKEYVPGSADCPIDNKIKESVYNALDADKTEGFDKKEIEIGAWSKLDTEEDLKRYINLQNRIREICKKDALAYDFDAWQVGKAMN